MKKTKGRDKQLEEARRLAKDQTSDGLVGVYDYWCMLDPGYDFPFEGMEDGTACNMHGGTLRIVEKVRDNGSRYYYVEAQRCWKSIMDGDGGADAAQVRKETLEEPLDWSSPLITVHRDDPEGGVRYRYDYKIPTLSSELVPLTVEIVGTTELRVKESIDGRAVILEGTFHYRQGSVTEGGSAIGAAIFRTQVASRWTTMTGKVELRRKYEQT